MKCKIIIKNREGELITHIQNLERKLSQSSYSHLNHVRSELDRHSEYSNNISEK
jgi:hypothetical protein